MSSHAAVLPKFPKSHTCKDIPRRLLLLRPAAGELKAISKPASVVICVSLLKLSVLHSVPLRQGASPRSPFSHTSLSPISKVRTARSERGQDHERKVFITREKGICKLMASHSYIAPACRALESSELTGGGVESNSHRLAAHFLQRMRAERGSRPFDGIQSHKYRPCSEYWQGGCGPRSKHLH